MLSDQDKAAIIQTASQYNARRVLLFGSGANPRSESRDIDIAVEGVHPKKFFEFYGDMIFRVSKPVDIVDLDQKNRFTKIIRKEGIVIYDKSERAA